MTEDEYLATQALTRYRAAKEILRDVITEHDQYERAAAHRALQACIDKGYAAVGRLKEHDTDLPPAEAAVQAVRRATATMSGDDVRRLVNELERVLPCPRGGRRVLPRPAE